MRLLKTHLFFKTFLLILLAAFAVGCGTSRKARKKDCDCPRWSYSQPQPPAADDQRGV
ncbi:MAG TPA: hypothetical protein VFC92_01625 [Bacteroidales bacterium]|nr:hypothetical protein [Bacteroidales bacterium]